MITLHHLRISRSSRIIWLLEELGLDYDLKCYDRTPEFRAPSELSEIHALGKAPTVEVDGRVMVESGAIIEYLVERHGGGKLAGEAMVKAIGAAGGKVLILHLATADSCVQRVRGFTEMIEAHNGKNKNAKILIAGTLPGGGNQQDSKKSTAAFVQGNKDLRAIFAINDPSALGAYAALKQAGMEGKVTIVGFDGEKAGKQAIKDGKIFADPIQYPDEMACITMDSILKYIDGREPEKLIKIPAKLYYKEDADKDPDLK